jgi:hypothetical protein
MTASTQPQPQWRVALDQANPVRKVRANVKRDIADGQRTAVEVITDPPEHTHGMNVSWTCSLAQHQLGPHASAPAARGCAGPGGQDPGVADGAAAAGAGGPPELGRVLDGGPRATASIVTPPTNASASRTSRSTSMRSVSVSGPGSAGGCTAT